MHIFSYHLCAKCFVYIWFPKNRNIWTFRNLDMMKFNRSEPLKGLPTNLTAVNPELTGFVLRDTGVSGVCFLCNGSLKLCLGRTVNSDQNCISASGLRTMLEGLNIYISHLVFEVRARLVLPSRVQQSDLLCRSRGPRPLTLAHKQRGAAECLCMWR